MSLRPPRTDRDSWAHRGSDATTTNDPTLGDEVSTGTRVHPIPSHPGGSGTGPPWDSPGSGNDRGVVPETSVRVRWVDVGEVLG